METWVWIVIAAAVVAAIVVIAALWEMRSRRRAHLRDRFGAIPAVLVSGASSAEDLARIEASGVLLLHKPVSPARLRSVLAHLVGTSALHPAPGDLESRDERREATTDLRAAARRQPESA